MLDAARCTLNAGREMQDGRVKSSEVCDGSEPTPTPPGRGIYRAQTSNFKPQTSNLKPNPLLYECGTVAHRPDGVAFFSEQIQYATIAWQMRSTDRK